MLPFFLLPMITYQWGKVGDLLSAEQFNEQEAHMLHREAGMFDFCIFI